MLKKPIVQLILLNFREFYREPGILFWAFVFPIAMAWGLGIAFTHKPEQKRDIALIQQLNNPDTSFSKILKLYSKPEFSKKDNTLRFVIRTGTKKTGFTIFRFIPVNWSKASKMLKQGSIVIILEEKDGKLNYNYDPYNTDAQLTYMQLSSLIKNGNANVDEAEIKPITQFGSRYIDFLIPGLIAMNLMMSTMWGISYTLIETRSKKLLRRMVATPMRKSSFLMAQIIARFVLNLIEATIVFTFAYYYFGITISGSYLALAIIYLMGMLCFSGISILVSSRTSNTYIGNGLINAVVMPMMLLSGIFFSYHNFPDAVVPYIQALPLTMFADAMRAIFIEGAGFADVWIQTFVLGVIGLSTFIVGLKIYKWY
jgi:ABC-type multidrug transport system permease subunit